MRYAQELKDNNEAHFADAGGFVSPSGISYIGVSKEKLGKVRASRPDARVQSTGAIHDSVWKINSSSIVCIYLCVLLGCLLRRQAYQPGRSRGQERQAHRR